tara:strand:+ start:1126 stop:2067 length:942 start_codon:yes stop_codon:yes gene_type:complete
MAYLDNSGDIILDAVLTDTGRMRLAKGDGSFKIVKFALADDEINYALYDSNHPSGSAYYDLQILQSPVLEAFTNNASSMKSRLLTISRNDLLYLPVVKLNTLAGNGTERHPSVSSFVIAVDETTVGVDTSNGFGQLLGTGILNGNVPGESTNSIRIDQGLDTTEISRNLTLDPDLVETQYIIEMDNRLGYLVSPAGMGVNATTAQVSFIDDDQIATYYLTLNTDPMFISNLAGTEQSSVGGPTGTRLEFRIGATTNLRTNSHLFDKLGSSAASLTNDAGIALGTHKFIDTTIRVSGVTTGYSLDIPVRYVKKS